MKQTVPNLFLGQRVWAVIEEILSSKDMIVSFQGDLVRVQNQSLDILRPGQRILLKVTTLQPLGFQLLDAKSLDAKFYNKLDVSI